MNYEVRKFENNDINEVNQIWNEVVEDGMAFPQIELLNTKTGLQFFNEQTYTGVCIEKETEEIAGLYILHPNNIGRCGHICNASYAVKKSMRGKHLGELLVKDCIQKAKEFNFRILQFNAVVAANISALKLYKKLGFAQLGKIPKGFLTKDGIYEDIIPHYIELN
ncbi:GNAT family N-acetyltransferase [bacterium]|nr:GNAT family N-acetyltransferase [bacterium]